MSLFINTNVASLNATRQLFTSNNSLSKAFERLSSGFRNANDGATLAQIIGGCLAEMTSSLQIIQILAVQSQNATNSFSDTVALQKQKTALKKAISRIASISQFGGVNVSAARGRIRDTDTAVETAKLTRYSITTLVKANKRQQSAWSLLS
jgi:flagellin